MKRWLIFGLVIIAIIIALVLISLSLTPQATNPAFDIAVKFANAAGKGDDAAALPLLSPELRAWVQENCQGGRPSACVQNYIPPEWGKLVSAVFRRASPAGSNWNVDVITTYQWSAGASGACSYFRVEPDRNGTWFITGWAGFIWCGDGRSRDMESNPNTPNRVP
ncbi:MAG: hypothetical protein R3E39_26125 [Anaerolineae bacterium]